jgi:hypothetical protein
MHWDILDRRETTEKEALTDLTTRGYERDKKNRNSVMTRKCREQSNLTLGKNIYKVCMCCQMTNSTTEEILQIAWGVRGLCCLTFHIFSHLVPGLCEGKPKDKGTSPHHLNPLVPAKIRHPDLRDRHHWSCEHLVLRMLHQGRRSKGQGSSWRLIGFDWCKCILTATSWWRLSLPAFGLSFVILICPREV